ncbi:glucan 1,4-alpha-glucosidase [Cellvibrio zantedeschiae]|nr:glucan 1,4-alpha-glucosidase [Cellvibrio zantedeschiae]
MKKRLSCLLISSLIGLSACKDTASHSSGTATANDIAPGAPGAASHWSYSGKNGIGTSYEQYTQGQYQDTGSSGKISKVWFSLAQGVLTETMFGLIHEAQIQEAQFYIKGNGFLHQEKTDTISHIDYLDKDASGRPLSLAYKIINRDKEGRYEIEKHIFTDPDTNSLMMKVSFRAFADNVTPFLYINPNLANTGPGDKAWSENNSWLVADGKTHLTVKTDAPVSASTVGFEGVSDGINDLIAEGKLSHTYASTGDTTGNVAMTLQLPTLKKGEAGEWQFVLGFGNSKDESLAAANQTLTTGHEKVLANFNGKGDTLGWEDYIASLPELEKLSATATDGGKLVYASALVLKAQEDKTYAGGVIASLSNPWGDSASADKAQTGYKAVWPRDFYQVTMAMLALGDKVTPKVAFEYLEHVQTSNKTPGYSGTPGWFLQKTHVDGEVEWVGVQLDQTAMPIMLGWRLWKEGVLSDAEMLSWYNKMLKPAATFLADGGTVSIDWLKNVVITPPKSIQERWEEQPGYSPSTTAAVITGLVAASDMAKLAKDDASAKKYLAAADKYSANLEKNLYTTTGALNKAPSDGNYYLRISANENPNDHALLEERNGQSNVNESEVVDGGFLELVRYGVRSPLNKEIQNTLPEMDDTSLPDPVRVKYEFSFNGVEGKFPGWRRYGRDGYGEDTLAGRGYNATGKNLPEGRGRVWPIFTGERGHYELAKAATTGKLDGENITSLRNTYIKAMELFANEGYMIPEQVWDGVGSNDTYKFTNGQGTNSATPLAWSHAEYVKLLRSYADKKVWDNNASTATRYVK